MSRYIDADILIKKYIDTDIEKFNNSDVKIVLENLKQNILKAPTIEPCEDAVRVYEYLKEKLGNEIVSDQKEFEAWFERVRWHVKRCDELGRMVCEDAISREAVKEEIRKPTWKIANKGELIAMINFIPSVAPSRPQGEWVDSDGDIFCCSNCGAEAPIDEWEYKYRDKIRSERTNFCPTCGVYMKGADNED